MFEYHGWVTVWHSPGDDSDAEHERACAAVEDAIRSLRSGSGLADFRRVNGAAQIHIAGLMNHRGSEGQEVVDSFRNVGIVAPGSYGVMYVWDDEDSSGARNEFQVMVMRRGRVTVTQDGYLSPCIPVIEDTL